MKIIIKIASWFIAAFGTYYCIARFLIYYELLPEITFNNILIFKILAFAATMLLAWLLLCQAWRLLLISDSPVITFKKTIIITGLSQIAKYIPSNLLHYVGKMALSIKEGLNVSVVATSMTLEVLISIASVAIVIITGLFFDLAFRKIFIDIASVLNAQLYFIIPIIVLIVFTVVLVWDKIRNCINITCTNLDVSVVIQLLIMYAAVLVLNGVMVKIIPWALWNDSSMQLSHAVWRISLCWIAGFMVPGAPAGLGVREALFIKLFSPEMGEGAAACVALVYRVATTLGDLLIFAAAWWLNKKALDEPIQSLEK